MIGEGSGKLVHMKSCRRLGDKKEEDKRPSKKRERGKRERERFFIERDIDIDRYREILS